MATISKHDHSNTPGAIKRRKAARRRWAVACVAALIGIIGVAQTVGGPVPAEAVGMETPAPQVAQMKTITAVPGKLPEPTPEPSEEAVVEEPVVAEAVAETQASAAPVEAEPELQPVETEPEWFTVEATAYCSCAKCCGEWANKRPGGVVYTADGSVAQAGVTIAADWDVFPAGTVLYIEGLGERIVQDRGGAINGYDVDVYHDDHNAALQFGRQHLQAYVVSYGG